MSTLKDKLELIKSAVIGSSKLNYESVRENVIAEEGYDVFRALQSLAFHEIFNEYGWSR